jgi:hypothetical protein
MRIDFDFVRTMWTTKTKPHSEIVPVLGFSYQWWTQSTFDAHCLVPKYSIVNIYVHHPHSVKRRDVVSRLSMMLPAMTPVPVSLYHLR